MSNFFAMRAATDQRVLKRSCESLLGICAGLICDGSLNDEEIRYLDIWLRNNDQLSVTWPGEVVVACVQDILSDGLITEEEREYLRKSLSDLLGGALSETGAAGGTATRLPINNVETIKLAGSSFCFTGDFLFGTRKVCEKAVTERGGVACSSVKADLHYLVVGTMASRDWAHSSHGRKIEKALEYQKKGRPVLVVSEEQWVQFL